MKAFAINGANANKSPARPRRRGDRIPAEDCYLLGQPADRDLRKVHTPLRGCPYSVGEGCAHHLPAPVALCRPSLHYARKQSRARTHANEQKIVVQFSNPSIPASALVCLLLLVANIELLSPSACQLLQSYLIDLAANLALHLLDLLLGVDRIRLSKVED